MIHFKTQREALGRRTMPFIGHAKNLHDALIHSFIIRNKWKACNLLVFSEILTVLTEKKNTQQSCRRHGCWSTFQYGNYSEE